MVQAADVAGSDAGVVNQDAGAGSDAATAGGAPGDLQQDGAGSVADDTGVVDRGADPV